jgi:CHAD domain-containing protein
MQPASASPSHQGLEDLKTRVAYFQKRAYVDVRDALRSPRYSRLLLSLAQWLTQRDWRNQLKKIARQRLDSPVKDFASQMLQSHYQHICQQGENFTKLNTEQRHELRISIKKMVYCTRFFAELYPRKIVRPYAKNLSQLQDELGILNDANVATDLLNKTGLDENAPARHFLNGWYAHQQVNHLTRLKVTWQTFMVNGEL